MEPASTHPILACRQVNKYWKCVVEKLMEPATISALEMEFRGRSKSEQNRVKAIKSLIPTLYQSDKSIYVSYLPRENIWWPNYLKETNPFPFNSLAIVGSDDGTRTNPSSGFTEMSVLKLMTGWDFGLNLTSFMLCDFHISLYILKLLLQQMPNLKVVHILNGHVVLDDGDLHLRKNKFKLPPLDQLKVLKCRNNRVLNQPGEFSRPVVSSWVVNSYAGSKTLTHLEFEDDDEKLRLSLDNFPSLKSLKLRRLTYNILSTSQSLPLEQLSINDVDGTTFEEFTDFLEKFSPTLVHLEIDGVPIYLVNPERFDFGKKITCNLPNLKFFCWDYPTNREAMQALALYFLPRFPALEKLELVGFRFSTEKGHGWKREGDDNDDPLPQGDEKEITDFLERQNYWGLCKKLESIHIFHRWGSKKDPIYVCYMEQMASNLKVESTNCC